MGRTGRNDTFDAELTLDRLEAQLAAELPAHLRAFSAAYVAGQPAPSAPEPARNPASLAVARRALDAGRSTQPSAADSATAPADSELSARALGLLRLLVPIAIEDDAAVAAARGPEPSWDAWPRLLAARDSSARRRFGVGHVELLHELHGLPGSAAPSNTRSPSWPAPLDGWHDPAPNLTATDVERAWRDLASLHGARGICRIVRADARPRAFIVEPGREVTVVIGPIDTPAMRFAAIHELGHAVAALIVPRPLARVVDEAAAAYVARMLEHEGALDLPWFTPIAATARARRVAISAALDAIERGASDHPLAKPPWALWNDPAAQAAYVAAEAIADRWWTELGALPEPGALAAAIRNEQRRIDQAGSALIT